MRLSIVLITILLVGLLITIPASAALNTTPLLTASVVNWSNNTVTAPIAGSVLPVVQGVTTTDNIDVSKTDGSQIANFYYAPNYYAHAQQFQANKSQVSAVVIPLNKTGSPTGLLTVSIQTDNANTPSGTIIASNTFDLSGLTTSYAYYTISVPALLTPSSKYWVVEQGPASGQDASNYAATRYDNLGYTDYRAAKAGTGSWSSDQINQYEVNVLYSKNTEDVSVLVNGTTLNLYSNGTSVSDPYGWQHGQNNDLTRNRLNWTNPFNNTQLLSGIYSADSGGNSTSPSAVNNWSWPTTGGLMSANDTITRSIVYKINSPVPLKQLDIYATVNNGNVATGSIDLSHDGITWKGIGNASASASSQTIEAHNTDIAGNYTAFIRLYKNNQSGFVRWEKLVVNGSITPTAAQNSTLATMTVPANTAANINISSFGNAASSSLDPSNRTNIWVYVNESAAHTITADFTASNTSGIEPLLVQFTDTSTTSDATIDAWNWSFADGSVSSSQNPLHTFANNGSYSVNLTITNTSYSLVSTKLMTITVYSQPACDFSSFNTQGTAPFTTYLYDLSTDLNPGPYTYYWDLGDGNTSTSQNLFFTWNKTGTYIVKHSVTDSVTTVWNNKTDYVTVGTAVIAPVASFYGGPELGAPPLYVYFTDASSNSPTSWNWSFGDGTFSTSQNPEKWYNQSGFYTVNLTATNSAGTNSTSKANFIGVY